MFGIVIDDILYFKVDDKNRADYVDADSEPFTYEAKGKTIALSYWMVPAEILEDQKKFNEWAQRAYDAAVRAKLNKK